MTSQTQYWNRLIQPGIVALVGAGGKTTVLSKLVEYVGCKDNYRSDDYNTVV